MDLPSPATKPFSSGTFPFSKFGGIAALVECAFHLDTPDRMLQQVIELPDGSRYLPPLPRWSAARLRPIRNRNHALLLGLGCEIRHASKLVYANGLDLEKIQGTPIGVNCRLCERGELQPARRTAADPHAHPRRKHPAGVIVLVQQCTGAVSYSYRCSRS